MQVVDSDRLLRDNAALNLAPIARDLQLYHIRNHCGHLYKFVELVLITLILELGEDTKGLGLDANAATFVMFDPSHAACSVAASGAVVLA